MTSGRPAMALGAVSGWPMSAAKLSTAPKNFAGLSGTITSVSVSFSIALPLSAPSLTRRAVSLRPIIPAAPVIRMCIALPVMLRKTLQRHPAVDQMGLAGNVAGLVAGKKERKQGYFLDSAEPAHRLALDKAFPHCIVRLSALLGERVDPLLKRRRLDGAWTDRVTTD